MFIPATPHEAANKGWGEPELFCGITGGNIDSLVANYTASKKKRKQDDFTPGGLNTRRPDRAVIVYSNLVRRFFKKTKPIVIGGIEASLRRIAHYDFWSNQIRKSILLDAKADILVYGMGEKTVLELADRLKQKKNYQDIKGLSYLSKTIHPDYLKLPDFSTVVKDQTAFSEMFTLFYNNCDPLTGKGLYQQYGDRYLIQNPPNTYLSQSELDAVYNLDFQRDLHPIHKKDGPVKALETIKFSLTTHRGCYGECNFCSVAVHQGRTIRWRSEESIVREATQLTQYNDFHGNILDAGGPTANMYGFECKKKIIKGTCTDKRCLFPVICPNLKPDHNRQIHLLRKLKKIKGVKKVFISSGLRYDLKFKHLFFRSSKLPGNNQSLTYYLIPAHPGCHEKDMHSLREYAPQKLQIRPEQIQIFTPTPSTYSTLMYYTQEDPFTKKKIFVEKKQTRKIQQKTIIIR